MVSIFNSSEKLTLWIRMEGDTIIIMDNESAYEQKQLSPRQEVELEVGVNLKIGGYMGRRG